VLGKHLDLATHYIDAALVRSIEFEHSVLVRIAQHFARQRHDARRLSDARRALCGPHESEPDAAVC